MKFLLVLVFTLISFWFPSLVMAVDVTLNYASSNINNSEFSIKYAVKGAKQAKNYLRIVLHKDGQSSNFAETWNGNEWYGGSEGKLYFPIDVNGSLVEGEVKGRLSSKTVNGNYILTIKRYTASGNASDDNVNSLPVSVQVDGRDVSSSTPEPKVIATKEPTASPVQSSITDEKEEPLYVVSEVKALQTEIPTELPKTTSTPLSEANKAVLNDPPPSGDFLDESELTFAAIPAVLGIGFILIGVFLFWKRWKELYNWE